MKLSIKNLSVNLGVKNIIRNFNLEINSGKLHVLMGPNGSGKSTLAQALMGSGKYELNSKSKNLFDHTEGNFKLRINNKDISNLKTEERAKAGLFLVFQNPIGIPGVNVANLLKVAYQEMHPGKKNGQSKHNPALSIWDFNQILVSKCKDLGIPQEFLRRSLNEEFSGGEKKKLEMLQALVLQPKFAIFDEIDTGLDVDALKIVAEGIEKLKSGGTGVLVITHYQRILRFLKVDFVHILVGGRLVESGGYKLVEKVEEKGYKSWMKN